jgi:uncharacterized membrane protein
LEDLDIGGRTVLKWILQKYDRMIWTGIIRLITGSVAVSCEHNNKLSSSIEVREFIDWLSD